MPAHTHQEQFPFSEGLRQLAGVLSSNNTEGTQKALKNNLEHVSNESLERCNTRATGGSQAHNNMPPYLTVFMWKRTA